MEGEEGGCVMLNRLLKRSSTNFWRMLCEGCGVCEVCVCVVCVGGCEGCVRGVCVGRDVLINISVCGEWSGCTCVCMCSVPLLTAFWGGKFQ